MEAASISEELAMGGVAVAAAVAVAGTLTFAALSASSQLFGHTLIAGRDPDELALTFDDGPNDNATPQLLDLLAGANVRATFFMLGKYVRQRPELVRRVHAAGHLIGNHTETHPWLHLKPVRVIREEIRACNHALEDVLGAPLRYFRPPHGARRPAVLQVARELGLETVQWNAVGHDWMPIGAARILADIEAGLARARRRGMGGNILLHDGSDRGMGANRADTLAATALLLQRSASDGSRLVTVDAWG
jgi:peptidoglycan/xylan/chitin deacetylase (PgdA/CDA1 family)